ncbi:MAG TPA: ABC transporter ATP-binding protein/permease [Acidothermaceae bacterium]|nr:ABC transporter ATP-binding protein/permease [Acidothermaceae bacterium]
MRLWILHRKRTIGREVLSAFEELGVAVVEVVHLRKSYGSTRAVEDVSFEVADGEIFGLLGPNGAGKTTTVESVVGLRVPDGGTIRVLGVDPSVDDVALRDRVGVQLQESALPAKLRVGEALALYASFFRAPDDPERLINALGLAAKSQSYFRELSGGQKQRLSIALALIGQPKIAVLDELTTGLDPQARKEVWSLVERLREDGVTILLVTHDMDEAEHLCDRVALIDAGRVVAIDSPARLAEQATGGKQLRFRPSGPFDTAVLTDLPEVRAVEHNGDWVTVTGEGDLVNAVILALAAAGVAAHDVVMSSAALEDAFLALVGNHDDAADGTAAPAPSGPVPDREHRAFQDWRSLLPSRRSGGHAPPRAAFRRLVGTEWRLAVRNPAGLVWGMGLPLLLLILFASLPGTTKPDKNFNGLSFFQIYLPVLVALSLALLSLVALPLPLTSYRELGVLRRMRTTPVPPSWLLGAQLVLNLVMLAFVSVLVIVGGGLSSGAHLPRQVPGFLLSLVLGTVTMFAIGLWVASIARTQRAAGAIGGALLYPMMFFAGVWVPQQVMPSWLRDVSQLTGLGAAVEAMQSSIEGNFPSAIPLLVMVVWTAAFSWFAVRMFRWE